MMAKVYQKTDFETCGTEVIHHLGAMSLFKGFHGLDFKNHFIEADKVRNTTFPQLATFVGHIDTRLLNEGNAPETKLDLQAFLENVLDESAAFFAINLEARTKNRVRLFLKQQCHNDSEISVCSVYSVV